MVCQSDHQAIKTTEVGCVEAKLAGLGCCNGWLAGIVCGWWIMPRIPDAAFAGFLGWFILGFINHHSLMLDLVLVPAVLLGGVAGRLLLRRVPQRLFEWITIALAAAAALRLIVQG
ncbi:MAG: hypothetical protein IAE97_11540 [Chthoniobacterales bacterium]|nr:hypothetical protein [Chthoniobacterales bacterium]